MMNQNISDAAIIKNDNEDENEKENKNENLIGNGNLELTKETQILWY